MRPGGLWTRLELRAETGSTNADAVEAARAGEPEGLIVVAERQTAGRGRQDRAWISPARAGLAVSLLLRPGAMEVPPRRYGWLPLLAGVALVESVSRLAGLTAALKWPNDLLIDGRKCAGILAEVVPGEAGPDTGEAGPDPDPAVVIGIGLNVTLRRDELPVDPTGQLATSLALAEAAATDRDPLLRALLRSFASWYERWRQVAGDADRSGLAVAYQRHCDTLGRQVRVTLPDSGELAGTAVGLDADGRLVVRTGTGERRVVASGDIRHLR